MSLRYSVNYVQLFDKTDSKNEVIGTKGKGVTASTSLSFNYYISPKLRLNATSSLDYRWQDSKDDANIINLSDNYLFRDLASGINSDTNYFEINRLINSFWISMEYDIF